jgi:hypothetical protein
MTGRVAETCRLRPCSTRTSRAENCLSLKTVRAVYTQSDNQIGLVPIKVRCLGSCANPEQAFMQRTPV